MFLCRAKFTLYCNVNLLQCFNFLKDLKKLEGTKCFREQHIIRNLFTSEANSYPLKITS